MTSAFVPVRRASVATVPDARAAAATVATTAPPQWPAQANLRPAPWAEAAAALPESIESGEAPPARIATSATPFTPVPRTPDHSATVTPADRAAHDRRAAYPAHGNDASYPLDAAYLEVSPAPPIPRVWREELGALAPFATDPAVTDLFVNGAQGLFIDRGSGPVLEPTWHADEAEVRALATALISRGGRHIDEASPCVDVRLAEGARVHAVLPPIARHGTTISVRVPSLGQPGLTDLAARGMFRRGGAAMHDWLQAQVQQRTNVLISGAAGAGKTTLLAAMLAEASTHERIVTIEDVAELRIDHPHHVSLESRQSNIEGAGEISLARLVREALRMRPDRLVVGECRGVEVRELLSALNTGHSGGAGTVHANGLAEVPARLEALGALCGMSDHALARQAVSAIGLVLHVERTEAGHQLAGVGMLDVHDGRLAVTEVRPWL